MGRSVKDAYREAEAEFGGGNYITGPPPSYKKSMVGTMMALEKWIEGERLARAKHGGPAGSTPWWEGHPDVGENTIPGSGPSAGGTAADWYRQLVAAQSQYPKQADQEAVTEHWLANLGGGQIANVLSDPYDAPEDFLRQEMGGAENAYQMARQRMSNDTLSSGAGMGGVARGQRGNVELGRGAGMADALRKYNQYRIGRGDQNLAQFGMPIVEGYLTPEQKAEKKKKGVASNILGGIGTAVGAFYGGPVGATAGGAIGSGLGGAIDG